MSQPRGESEDGRARSCKIDRIAAEYDLADEAKRLPAYWTRDDERYSLRQLATHFNQQLLRAAMEQDGLTPLEGEVENTYRLLTDGEVSEGMRIQARNYLRKHDIDVEHVEAEFVSYQTVNRHLKQCLGVERSPDQDDDSVEKSIQRIAALQNRTRAVTETTLSQLRSANEFTLGDIDVFVDITVTCADCGTHATVRDLIEESGCQCAHSTPS